MKKTMTLVMVAGMLVTLLAVPTSAQDNAEDLAKKLANPVASLISVPIQANYDENMGSDEDGSVWKVNIQPVIPVSLNDDWNLISRTILPIIDQTDIPTNGAGESGIGDIVQSAFFSPKESTANGWVLAVGPVFLLPTASDDALGGEKWGVGPTALALKQIGPWTVGGLMNHIWSVAGEDDRVDVNATYLQPFVSYVTKTKTTLGVSIESTYDWESEEWLVPVNATVNQMLKIGSQIIQVGGGLRYWADSPEGAPQDLGFRLQLTMLFPK